MQLIAGLAFELKKCAILDIQLNILLKIIRPII